MFIRLVECLGMEIEFKCEQSSRLFERKQDACPKLRFDKISIPECHSLHSTGQTVLDSSGQYFCGIDYRRWR